MRNMTWRYYVYEEPPSPAGDICYTIHPVYKDDDGALSTSVDRIYPVGDTIKELRADLMRMVAACDAGVITKEQNEELILMKVEGKSDVNTN